MIREAIDEVAPNAAPFSLAICAYHASLMVFLPLTMGDCLDTGKIILMMQQTELSEKGRECMNYVRDILKAKDKTVQMVAPDSTVYDALKLMSDKEIGALIVMEGGRVVGIFSERDYARKITLQGKTSKETLVKEIMSSDLHYVNPANTTEECMVLMTGKHVRHLPVFDKGEFVGIISIGDVVKSIISNKEFLIEQLSNYISGSGVPLSTITVDDFDSED
jgi:CBS domain-containing protein